VRSRGQRKEEKPLDKLLDVIQNINYNNDFLPYVRFREEDYLVYQKKRMESINTKENMDHTFDMQIDSMIVRLSEKFNPSPNCATVMMDIVKKIDKYNYSNDKHLSPNFYFNGDAKSIATEIWLLDVIVYFWFIF
jgi:hypothetical protein